MTEENLRRFVAVLLHHRAMINCGVHREKEGRDESASSSWAVLSYAHNYQNSNLVLIYFTSQVLEAKAKKKKCIKYLKIKYNDK